jgi:hypothetical protein
MTAPITDTISPLLMPGRINLTIPFLDNAIPHNPKDVLKIE